MGIGARYSAPTRGVARKHHQSRASRKVVLAQQTSAGHNRLLPGHNYDETAWRESDGEGVGEVKRWRAVQTDTGWEKGESLATTPATGQGRPSSVVKDKTDAMEIAYKTLPPFEAIMLLTLMNETKLPATHSRQENTLLDEAVGMSRRDFVNLLLAESERLGEYQPISLASLEELMEEGGEEGARLSILDKDGLHISEDGPSPAFWTQETWGRIIDLAQRIGNTITLARGIAYLEGWGDVPSPIEATTAETLTTLWEIGPKG